MFVCPLSVFVCPLSLALSLFPPLGSGEATGQGVWFPKQASKSFSFFCVFCVVFFCVIGGCHGFSDSCLSTAAGFGAEDTTWSEEDADFKKYI